MEVWAESVDSRAVRVGIVLAVALVAVNGAFASRTPARTLTPLESGVLTEINAFRAQHGLTQLRLSRQLTNAARAHSVQMGADGYFAHDSADGALFWQRIQDFYGSSLWRYWSVGENLLWSSPDVDPHRALEMWLASPEHKRNLTAARWREVGIAAVHVRAAPGVYKGLDVTIVTTDFGVRH
jgi:uncharacterized protein YkwD